MRPFFFILVLFSGFLRAQSNFHFKGQIMGGDGEPVPFATVGLVQSKLAAVCNDRGYFSIPDVPAGTYTFVASAPGYNGGKKTISIPRQGSLKFYLQKSEQALEEVVVTGTLKESGKDDSPVNVDIITPRLLQKTTTPNLFEATSLVNGVKPQINCNVCNTGDIHINGLEGPYTLILIDGMPIVSGLSSVYGLMGVPASIIERLEIVKGPAGALYGSEAMGGTINLITKKPQLAPAFYLDYYGTSYLENNLDLSGKVKLGRKVDWLIGSNTYYYDHIKDINHDGFTDVTLQKRSSLFNKVAFYRKDQKEFTLAGRYVFEDRWGGQTNWTKQFRGGDSIYGESIYANRGEFIGNYQWPGAEKIYTQVSWNLHDQNSVYGKTSFIARQSTGFTQTYWTKNIGRNDLLIGITYKNLWYDDNTVVTLKSNGINAPDRSNTIGLFVQNETLLDSLSRHRLLYGLRLDYNDVYRFIPSPRIAYKWSPNYRLTFRLNFGTGFRIVNVFTEDHMALTGAREVVFLDQIRPERSVNGSFNTVYKMRAGKTSMLIWDGSLFYYHFSNKIFANYDADPQKVIYQNLNGHAFSRGGSLNLSLASIGNFKFNLGATLADVQNVSKDSSGQISYSRQLQAPKYSGNLVVGYHLPQQRINIDLTGNWYGPQRLPVLPNDFRPEYSPWFCLLNLQVTKKLSQDFEIYLGGKNLLNFLPKHPIMRPFDPFDKQASDPETNPQGYTFDPSYNYAPIQGIRGYLGLRLSL
jgi:outer membrane receptor for ferrienterochelin and colicins